MTCTRIRARELPHVGQGRPPSYIRGGQAVDLPLSTRCDRWGRSAHEHTLLPIPLSRDNVLVLQEARDAVAEGGEYLGLEPGA